MKLFVLCLLLAATIAAAQQVKELVGKGQLIKVAWANGTPYTEEARARITETGWGSRRSIHSYDVSIFNAAGKDFHLVESTCDLGAEYSQGLFPESNIPEGHASVYGIEAADTVICDTKYKSQDGSWFKMTDNKFSIHPYSFGASSSKDLRVTRSRAFMDDSEYAVRFITVERKSN